MAVLACTPPLESVLGRAAIQTAYFSDAYTTNLSRADRGIVEIYAGLFGHAPLYVKLILVARNTMARLAGLETPTVAEIMRVEIAGAYRVGDKIGPWPVFAINRDEIVAGRNNRHLDFRLSVFRQVDGGVARVTVSTLCHVHNLAGRIYLFFIKPFHRFGVKALMRQAIAAGRL